MRITALLLGLLVLQGWAAEIPRIVFIAGEYEYGSKQTLPALARELEQEKLVETVVLQRPQDPKAQTIPGLEALAEADLVVLFVRRMTLPEAELQQIRRYVSSGKPLIGLRTASHAFENWKEFDAEVLGGNYGNHYGNKLKTAVSIRPKMKDHPILEGVGGFTSNGSLYKNTPLAPGAKPLLMGKVEGRAPEPVAWTHEKDGARVFYTSLGHPDDFKEESFQRMVKNALDWALAHPLRPKESK